MNKKSRLPLRNAMESTSKSNLQGISLPAPSKQGSEARPPPFAIRFLRNKNCLIGLVIVSAFLFMAAFAEFLSPYSPFDVAPALSLRPPSPEHIFGTDVLGRDVYSRIIHGARISTYIAISTTLIALTVAIPVGMISGYVGGKVDQAVVGFMDILLSFPSILLAIVLVAILGVGLNNLILAIGVYSIPVFVRLIRGATLSVKETEYVKAAQTIGENGFNVVLRYILPNISPVIIVQATIRMGLAILSAAALGFLGLGVQSPLPEWGVMVADARVFIFAQPTLMVYLGIFILLFTLGFNLMGDGLNDLLNPRLRTY